MKRLGQIVAITLVILSQLFIVVKLTVHPVNVAKLEYRRTERAAAYAAFAQDQSAEKKAVYDREMKLASNHYFSRQFILAGVVLAVLFLFEMRMVYSLKPHKMGNNPAA